MEKGSLIGIAGANLAMVVSILLAPGAKFSAFVDYASIVMVVGGGAAAVMMAYPLGSIFGAMAASKKAFFPGVPNVKPIISQLVEFAEIARRDGILALENKTSEIADPFVLMGVQMAIDGTEAEVMEAVLRTEMESMAGRHKVPKAVMECYGKYAPAYGMIGTLLGLIIMLGNMDDPAAIGPGMAVALLTTLYGAYIANAAMLPLAEKLGFYSKKELEVREIIIRGLMSIQQGDNPRVLEQKLVTFLPLAQRADVAKKKDAA